LDDNFVISATFQSYILDKFELLLKLYFLPIYYVARTAHSFGKFWANFAIIWSLFHKTSGRAAFMYVLNKLFVLFWMKAQICLSGKENKEVRYFYFAWWKEFWNTTNHWTTHNCS